MIKNLEKQRIEEKEAIVLNFTKENRELKEEIKNLQTQLQISLRDNETLKDDFGLKLNEKDTSIKNLKEKIQTIDQKKNSVVKENTPPNRSKRIKNLELDTYLYQAINLNNDVYEENLVISRLNLEMEEFSKCIKSLNLKFEVLRKQIIEKFSNIVTQYNHLISVKIKRLKYMDRGQQN